MDNRRRSLTSVTKEVSLNGAYTINLGGWTKSSKQNPNTNLYDGVYESYSNYNVDNSAATMTITINGLNTFTIYIRSNGEPNYDYVMVSQLDKDINNNTTYSNTTLVKAHTHSNANSANTFNSYTKVEFTEIGGGTHKITIVYRKDFSSHQGDDKGYLFIDRNYEVYGDVISPIMVDEYLTIESLEDGLTATLYGADDCEYCIDGSGEWKKLTSNYSTESINDGQTLSFRGNLTPNTSNGIGTFSVDKKFNLKGNCMSMIFGDAGKENFSLGNNKAAFMGLFNRCSNLVNVSENFLPATTLSDNCYTNMFRECGNLLSAPKLPSSAMTYNCYGAMFAYTKLQNAPELPSLILAESCYAEMFAGCTELVEAPSLNSTTLNVACYDGMFNGCTNLTTAPDLPAESLPIYCYREMFKNCTNLKSVKMLATDIPSDTSLKDWLTGVSSDGEFTKSSEMEELNYGNNGIPAEWTITDIEPIIIDDYLTIEALENDLEATLSISTCEYCINGNGYWKTLLPGEFTTKINSGQTLSFRGNLTPKNYDGIGTFTVNKKFNLKGNCMSMIFGDDGKENFSLSDKAYAFYHLFNNCTTLINVSKNFLPATSLRLGAYMGMFANCTSLITAPDLPATTISGVDCYTSMFANCTSLINVPSKIYAKEGVCSSTFSGMFKNCTSLITAPDLVVTAFSTDGDGYQCASMFANCTSLVNAPELPATTLSNGCYSNMFANCTSLVTTPELPATSVPYIAYYKMFLNCTSLKNISKINATSLRSRVVISSFDSQMSDMFKNCTSLETAPVLNIKTLKNSCYSGMFSGCANLNYIKFNATDISALGCLDGWMNGVSKTGVFVKQSKTKLPLGPNGIPEGWTIVNEGAIDVNDYLTIEAIEDGLTAKLSLNDCEYCVDGDGNWKILSANTYTESINSGHTLSFRANNLTPSSSQDEGEGGIGTFTVNKKFNLKGNCMSMIFGDAAIYNTNLNGKNFAFYKLFKNCENLINISEKFLPSTVISDYCYANMFYGCTNMISTPILPSVELQTNCYYGMFYGCSNLLSSPLLPAANLVDGCYGKMFQMCEKLSTIKMFAQNINATEALYNWVDGVSSDGTFIRYKYATWDVNGVVPNGWDVITATTINSEDYLTIEAIEDGLTAKLSLNDCEYCVDGDGKWKLLSANTYTESINSGHTLSFRANNLTPSNAQDIGMGGIGKFSVDKKFNLKGNCMSMMFGDDGKTTFSLYGKNNAFRGLFEQCTKLITVSKTFLPATTLSSNCYNTMFYGCTNMISAPDLPAKKATNSCYRLMFFLCSSLAEAPSLPATALEYSCYENMFYGCKSLTIAPVLPSSFVSQSGYYRMFKNCTNLTTVPLLAASTYNTSHSGGGQCEEMFYGCTSLNYVKTNLTSFNSTDNKNWMNGVKSSGTFVAPSTVDTNRRGVDGIPEGWVIEFF